MLHVWLHYCLNSGYETSNTCYDIAMICQWLANYGISVTCYWHMVLQ